jgi:hypothetical protein
MGILPMKHGQDGRATICFQNPCYWQIIVVLLAGYEKATLEKENI